MSDVRDNEKGVHEPGSPPHGGYDTASPTGSVSLDKDVAIGLVGEKSREIDPAVEAKVLRKIGKLKRTAAALLAYIANLKDWFLIPAMIVGMYQSLIAHKVFTNSRLQAMAWYTTTRPFSVPPFYSA